MLSIFDLLTPEGDGASGERQEGGGQEEGRGERKNAYTGMHFALPKLSLDLVKSEFSGEGGGTKGSGGAGGVPVSLL